MPFRLFALIAAILFAIAHGWHLELDSAAPHAGGPKVVLSAGLPDPDRPDRGTD